MSTTPVWPISRSCIFDRSNPDIIRLGFIVFIAETIMPCYAIFAIPLLYNLLRRQLFAETLNWTNSSRCRKQPDELQWTTTLLQTFIPQFQREAEFDLEQLFAVFYGSSYFARVSQINVSINSTSRRLIRSKGYQPNYKTIDPYLGDHKTYFLLDSFLILIL